MRWFAALLLCLIANVVLAQNPTCPTRPLGDNSNACASTGFVFNTSTNNIISTSITARPSSVAVWPTNAFTGDNSHIDLGINYSISGAATLGQPTTGYVITPEASPVVINLTSTSGFNNSNSTNSGRTLAAAIQVYGQQNGQGDFVDYFCDNQLNSNKVGATSWLANSAQSCVIGQIAASSGGAGGFINPLNWIALDNGFDVAFIGQTVLGTRTNATGALGTVWLGEYFQSTGSQPWDAFYSGVGPVKAGIDLTAITTQASGLVHAGMILKAGDLIYFNGTAGVSPSFIASATGTLSIGANVGGTGINITGTQTNDTAPAGMIGQFVTSGQVVTGNLTSGVTANVTSVSLTAGDWEVSGSIGMTPAGTTVPIALVGVISLTTANLTAVETGEITQFSGTMATGAAQNLPVPNNRVSLAGTTTIFLNINASFTTSTATGQGVLRARRVR